jgi:ketosteroid isomerase-like protein
LISRGFTTILLILTLWGPSAFAAGRHTPQSAEAAIKANFDKQATDWNHGDLTTFATAYKDSPDILFIGSKISRGYAQMLERYRSVYSTREKMGTLTFANVEVQPLDDRFATATGKFHLERTAAGGGNADGSYMLVFEKTPQGWKIVRDVTIPSPKQ